MASPWQPHVDVYLQASAGAEKHAAAVKDIVDALASANKMMLDLVRCYKSLNRPEAPCDRARLLLLRNDACSVAGAAVSQSRAMPLDRSGRAAAETALFRGSSRKTDRRQSPQNVTRSEPGRSPSRAGPHRVDRVLRCSAPQVTSLNEVITGDDTTRRARGVLLLAEARSSPPFFSAVSPAPHGSVWRVLSLRWAAGTRRRPLSAAVV